MQVTPRGLFASLGASGSLLAAAACALLALSTVVGYRGWPGFTGSVSAPGEMLVSAPLPAADEPADPVAAPPSLVVDAAPAPAAAPGGSGSRGDVAGTRTRPAAPRPTPAQAVPVATPAAPAPGAAPAPAATPQAAPAAGLAEPVRRVTRDAGQVVSGAGQAAGAVVQPASPDLGQAVTGLTGALGEAVAGTGRSAAGLLGP